MNIGLIDVDGKGKAFPNLALMKISAYYKMGGGNVEWYTPFSRYDKVYMSKVFNFSEDWVQVLANTDEVIKGGTGYDINKDLPQEIDLLQPDYSLYNIPNDMAYGFLTRGCPNKCKWCVVPKKEGMIRPYMDIEEIAIDGRNNIILMDNNILACDYGLEQIEKIIKLGVKVDFNQALDARLVTDEIAKMLAKVKWIKRIRFGCDTPKQISECDKAISMITKHGYNGEFFLYCILTDNFMECFERVNHWKKSFDGKCYLHCQPYRNPFGINTIPQWQKDMAGWADKKQVFKTCEFKDFEPRKGFKCKEYFDLKL